MGRRKGELRDGSRIEDGEVYGRETDVRIWVRVPDGFDEISLDDVPRPGGAEGVPPRKEEGKP